MQSYTASFSRSNARDNTDFHAPRMACRLAKSVFVLEYETRNKRPASFRISVVDMSSSDVRFFPKRLVEKNTHTRRAKEDAYEISSKRLHQDVALLKIRKIDKSYNSGCRWI